MRGKRLILLTLLLLALVPGAATAEIGIYARVLRVYQTNGSVPPSIGSLVVRLLGMVVSTAVGLVVGCTSYSRTIG